MVSDVAFQYMVLGLTLSIALNVITIAVSFGFGIGKRVVQRLKRRWLYKRGRHVNVILIRNNNTSDEIFVKKDFDGSFKIENVRYIVNPLCSILHDGIPTQLNREGVSEPININNLKDARAFSSAELENVIMANEGRPDLWSQYKGLIILFFVILVGFIVFSAYMNWKVFDAIDQKNLFDHLQFIATNSTTVAPR